MTTTPDFNQYPDDFNFDYYDPDTGKFVRYIQGKMVGKSGGETEFESGHSVTIPTLTVTSISLGSITVSTGTGAPTHTATKGSLYIRTDGGTNELLYINTDGSTTWAGVQTESRLT